MSDKPLVPIGMSDVTHQLLGRSPDAVQLPPTTTREVVARAVVQSGNSVAGDLAGGSIYKAEGNLSITHVTVPEKKNPAAAHMSRLIEDYKKEISNNADLKQMVDDLQHFVNQSKTDLRSLADKLIAGGRENEITLARELKENAVKKLMRHQTSVSAQLIYSVVLGNLATRFRYLINPLISGGETEATIDSAIQREIIDMAAELLAENPLNINSEELCGFLYLLTGNCHINWD